MQCKTIQLNPANCTLGGKGIVILPSLSLGVQIHFVQYLPEKGVWSRSGGTVHGIQLCPPAVLGGWGEDMMLMAASAVRGGCCLVDDQE